jgi:hypothetical protein
MVCSAYELPVPAIAVPVTLDPDWHLGGATALTSPPLQVQTPQQRRANAKFAKGNEARMGKSVDDIKIKTKEAPKISISPIWVGMCTLTHYP